MYNCTVLCRSLKEGVWKGGQKGVELVIFGITESTNLIFINPIKNKERERETLEP